MTTFKKGDKVYIVKTWDNAGTFSIRKAEVKSFGKVQATMFVEEDGCMAKELFYVDYINNHHAGTFILSQDEQDIEKVVLELAQSYLDKEATEYNRRHTQHSDETYELYNPSYANSMRDIADGHENSTPKIIWR